jgi:hypothetical protein
MEKKCFLKRLCKSFTTEEIVEIFQVAMIGMHEVPEDICDEMDLDEGYFENLEAKVKKFMFADDLSDDELWEIFAKGIEDRDKELEELSKYLHLQKVKMVGGFDIDERVYWNDPDKENPCSGWGIVWCINGETDLDKIPLDEIDE